MKQTVRIDGKTFAVELFPSEKRARINNHSFVYERAPGGIVVDGHFFHYTCVKNETGEITSVLLQGKSIPVEIGQGEFKPGKTQKTEVHAPLNGQVIELSAKTGSRVRQGDLVLTLEAMKMENEIIAPASGILKELSVKEKDVVKAGQLLFRIEPVSS